MNVAGEEDEGEGEQIYYEGEVMEDFVCKQRWYVTDFIKMLTN